MGWFETAQDGVYKALCAAFRLDPASADAMKRFVPAYVFSATTPIADRNVNVCYYDIKHADDPGFKYETIKYAPKDALNVKASVRRNLPLTALLTFYGPNADNDSEKFWAMCQADTDYRSPMSVLRKNQITLNGKPDFPAGLQEIEGTYIRRRCDVQLNLVLWDVNDVTYEPVDTAPSLVIRDTTDIIDGIHYQT